MLKHHYKVLKYIHKHPKINKADLLKKFPDFEACFPNISKYLRVEDKNQAIQECAESNLASDAMKICKSVSEISEYMSSHRKEIDYNNSVVTYSVKTSFQELLDEKRNSVLKSLLKTSLSFLKFIITYILGIASGLIIAYLKKKIGL